MISIVSTRKFIEAYPETILNILRATSEAIYLYKTRPDLTLPVVAKYMRVPKDDPALVQSQEGLGKFLNQYLTPSPEGIKFVLEFLADKQPSLKAKNPNDFVDDRFVRKLEEEGFFKKFSTQVDRNHYASCRCHRGYSQDRGSKVRRHAAGRRHSADLRRAARKRPVPLILTRHEQATVYIADGYARSTGEVGVAMVTKGPGRCNAFTAIVNAFTDCVPLVVIFGHSSRKQLAKGMLQEVPYLDTFQTMAKWTFSVPSAERIPEVFRRAFTLARSGRPGPVIIEVPQDISMAQAELPPYHKTRRVRFGPDPDDVDKLIELLQAREAAADLRRPRRALVPGDRAISSRSPKPMRSP